MSNDIRGPANSEAPVPIGITYNSDDLTGTLALLGVPQNAIWDRLQQAAVNSGTDYLLQGNTIALPWPAVLDVVREFGPQQKALNFRFRPAEGDTRRRVEEFVREYRQVREARGRLTLTVTEDEIRERLIEAGFE